MPASPDAPFRVEWHDRLITDQVEAVRTLAAAASGADGVSPLSEDVLLHLETAEPDRQHALLTGPGGELAGYGQLTVAREGAGRPTSQAELVVPPAFRGHQHGQALLGALRDRAGGRLRVWAHGTTVAATRVAATAGMRQVRVLWQVQRPLTLDLPQPTWPAGVEVRPFVPGVDGERWVACNARAFASHPEQGGWTLADLEQREAEPWFDAAGFFVALRPVGAGESAGRFAGFHWTKVHSDRPGGPIGEVYVIGVDPDDQGGGLGKALLLQGLVYLRDVRGLREVMLYVDEDNDAAMGLYERLGFRRVHADVMFETP